MVVPSTAPRGGPGIGGVFRSPPAPEISSLGAFVPNRQPLLRFVRVQRPGLRVDWKGGQAGLSGRISGRIGDPLPDSLGGLSARIVRLTCPPYRINKMKRSFQIVNSSR